MSKMTPARSWSAVGTNDVCQVLYKHCDRRDQGSSPQRCPLAMHNHNTNLNKFKALCPAGDQGPPSALQYISCPAGKGLNGPRLDTILLLKRLTRFRQNPMHKCLYNQKFVQQEKGANGPRRDKNQPMISSVQVYFHHCAQLGYGK